MFCSQDKVCEKKITIKIVNTVGNLERTGGLWFSDNIGRKS